MKNKSFVQLVVISLLASLAITACSDAGKGKTRKGKTHLVEVALAQYEMRSQTSERNGSLRAVQSAKLFNQEEGRVKQVQVREGDVVNKDDVLVRLDDGLVRAQYNKASASLRQAKQDLDRIKPLMNKKLISEETLGRTRTAYQVALAEQNVLRTRLDYTVIKAPFDGTIAERKIEPGDVAPKHTHLLTIVDPSRLISDVTVSELELPYIKVGSIAHVSIDALGKQRYSGKVIRIHPTVDPATRLGRIEVALVPVPSGARAGQFCRISLETSEHKRLMVPFAALRRDQEGELVYVVGKDNKVQKRIVASGLRMSDKVEIRNGLQPGERVVMRGFLGLDDGKMVAVVGDKADGNNTGGKKTRPLANEKKPEMTPAKKSQSKPKPQSKGLESNA